MTLSLVTPPMSAPVDAHLLSQADAHLRNAIADLLHFIAANEGTYHAAYVRQSTLYVEGGREDLEVLAQCIAAVARATRPTQPEYVERPAIVCRLKPEDMAPRGNPCGVAGCGAAGSARYGFHFCPEHGKFWEEA